MWDIGLSLPFFRRTVFPKFFHRSKRPKVQTFRL